MKTSFRLATVLVLLVASGPAAPGQTVATGRVMRERLTQTCFDCHRYVKNSRIATR